MKALRSTELTTAPALTVRVAQPHEAAAFDAQLADHHYLGAGRPVGDYLRQLVERDGHAVALLVMGPSCYALKDRDLWISWSASQRVERLKLVVQNRRFLLLSAKGQSPNLASQSLGAALRAPDPRDSSTQYRTGPVLMTLAMALLAGRRDIAEIARFATTLTQPQRRQLGLPRKQGTRAFHKVPGYGVFYTLLTRMDPEPFAARC